MDKPELALEPDISLFILVQGMFRGTFTGYRLGNFIGSSEKATNFLAARKIINGTDKAAAIRDLALKWLPKTKKACT